MNIENLEMPEGQISTSANFDDFLDAALFCDNVINLFFYDDVVL